MTEDELMGFWKQASATAGQPQVNYPPVNVLANFVALLTAKLQLNINI